MGELTEKEIYQIAIDGPAVSGKGTVARMLGQRLGYVCLDTGALYRAFTIHCLNKGARPVDNDDLERALESIDINVECRDGATHVSLDGEDVTSKLHDHEVCEEVFKYAQIKKVREKVRGIQRAMGAKQTLICEGRDITSVIFPKAKYKFYLTASLDARAQRRYAMEVAKGSIVTYEEVKETIRQRDYADATREESPLVLVKDATVVDASEISAAEAVDIIQAIIQGEKK